MKIPSRGTACRASYPYCPRNLTPDANPSQRVAGFGTTVFVEIIISARQTQRGNLGRRPDFDGPARSVAAASRP